MKIADTKKLYFRGGGMSGASGSTLMEVLIASSIGVLVLAALIGLMTTQVQEQRKEMVDSNLQQQANLLEDKITRLFRSMSAGQSVILGNPIATGSPAYRLIVVARGSAPIPREQVAFDPASFTLAYTPNYAVSGVREIYFGQSKLAVLRDFYFFISQKSDGASDASAITTYFKMDDGGMGHRGKTNTLVRTFTTTMRNN